MRVDQFDFELPEERIALSPAHPRDSARLLVVAGDGALCDRHVADLPDLLRRGDALVVNDTRVIAARLEGIRVRGDALAHVEATLIKRLDASRWRALARPAKKLKVGERIRFGETSESMACLLGALDAEVELRGEDGEVTLAFAFHGAALDEAIDRLGQAPLPPYIASRRTPDAGDRASYQTIFADEPGAVAAPTAGLHFTNELVARILAKGATLHRVTLHVGAGTFAPVRSALAISWTACPTIGGVIIVAANEPERTQACPVFGKPSAPINGKLSHFSRSCGLAISLRAFLAPMAIASFCAATATMLNLLDPPNFNQVAKLR